MKLATSLYAAILALFYFILMLKVVQSRWTERVGAGTGKSEKLLKRVRVHANFSENVPLTLILLFFVEYQGLLSTMAINIFGTTLVLARLIHALGLNQSVGKSFGRFYGSLANQAINVSLAVIIIINYLF